MNSEKIQKWFSHKSRVAVMGDMMVDQYLWGKVSRISPEAPVPIVEIDKEQIRPGGAANVAINMVNLQDEVLVYGVVGQDLPAQSLRSLLKENGVLVNGLIESSDRPTTMKTRIIGGSQQIARVDKENCAAIPSSVSQAILSNLEKEIHSLKAILLEDYNKGVLTKELIHEILRLAGEHNTIVTVDPKKENFFAFKGATVFKPNRIEAENAVGFNFDSEEKLKKAGDILLNELHCKYVLITLGSRGMVLFEKNSQPYYLETRAKDVADVSGAGDTVISTLTSLLAAGADIRTAVNAANIAAGISVAHVGVVTVSVKQILDELMHA